MNFSDLNQLSLRDIPNWPMLPKAGALVLLFGAILFAAYWFDWSQQLTDYDVAKQEEVKLKETFLAKKKQAVNFDTYTQQLKDIELSFGALLKQLPNKSEMEALLTDINQAGLGRGLQFELFRPGTETQMEFYAELPITVRVTGSYHDLGAFSSDIAQLSRIVTLHDLNINKSTGKDGALAMDAIVKTYRYLDEDELSAQKKKAKEAKK